MEIVELFHAKSFMEELTTKQGGAVNVNKYLQIHLQISTPVVNKYLQFDQNLLPGSREEIQHICMEGGDFARFYTPHPRVQKMEV